MPEEVEGAVAEGAELLTLQAPVRMESGPDGHVTALWTQPQIIGQADKTAAPVPTARISQAPGPGGYHHRGHRPGH
ncbi:MAG: hypothetical protein ACLTYN_02075 [Dysosmobacter welbionis]